MRRSAPSPSVPRTLAASMSSPGRPNTRSSGCPKHVARAPSRVSTHSLSIRTKQTFSPPRIGSASRKERSYISSHSTTTSRLFRRTMDPCSCVSTLQTFLDTCASAETINFYLSDLELPQRWRSRQPDRAGRAAHSPGYGVSVPDRKARMVE